MDLRSLPETHPFIRKMGPNPFPVDPAKAGATSVPQNESALLKGQGEPECLLGDLHFGVWKLPIRRMHVHANHSRNTGIRLGPQAGGAATDSLTAVERTLPALPKTSVRELMITCQCKAKLASRPQRVPTRRRGSLVSHIKVPSSR